MRAEHRLSIAEIVPSALRAHLWWTISFFLLAGVFTYVVGGSQGFRFVLAVFGVSWWWVVPYYALAAAPINLLIAVATWMVLSRREVRPLVAGAISGIVWVVVAMVILRATFETNPLAGVASLLVVGIAGAIFGASLLRAQQQRRDR